ncbi:MAG: VCBS domain-containing protein, partial [Magnetococcus sp. DMHC-6]
MGNSSAKGISIAFSNTPQAKDDYFVLNEENAGTVQQLDVMGNDLGGAAKSLYSLDDGVGIQTSELLTARTTSTSKLGVPIAIINEKISYDINKLLTLYSITNIQSMAAGEHLTDSFTYAIKLGSGALSWATATVEIVGMNDAAVITGVSTSRLTEDSNVNSGHLIASGKLDVTDVDHDQNSFASGTYQTPNALGSVSLDVKGNWTYVVDNAKVQHLAAGQITTDVITVQSIDGTSQNITITLVGINDVASFSGDTSGRVTEDGTLIASGTLIVSDVDDGQAQLIAATGESANGSFTVDADGQWTFTANNDKIQHLAAGQTITEIVTVQSIDGTNQNILVTLTGINDAATISGTSTGSVVEDGNDTATGVLRVADVDDGQA